MKMLRTLCACLCIPFTLMAQDLDIELVADGFNSPVAIENAGDQRLFVVQQGGLIRILNPDGSINPDPFLNISDLVSGGGERGLLGLAFHPNYAANGFFYVYYTDLAGDTQISRFRESTTNENLADPDSEFPILSFTQPYANHNAGCLAFGPDGYLYIASGDGGSGGDPQNYAQRLNTLLGKLLRIDVDNGSPYAIPSDNPFVGTSGAMPEIWAYGLRNPWKFSFDNADNALWIADVGQSEIEEINKVNSATGGQNYGWRCYEGDEAFNNGMECPEESTLTFPEAQYTHNSSGNFKCSITGGYVYRGSEQINLVGRYIFADYCSDELGILNSDGSLTYFGPFVNNSFSTFGMDVDQELYVAGVSSGAIYKVIDKESLSVEEEEALSIAITPNPTQEIITIQGLSPLSNNSERTIELYSLNGKRLSVYEAEGNSLAIDIGHLAPGLYLLKLSDQKGAYKIVKR
ncbi:PQQ-dependent sugar dehydrogenase [Croceiramulus getboli]|nr:PQQ-dependent sugar dehydrogenase [Flavobacteriaceae bacterium YJPT1-3]